MIVFLQAVFLGIVEGITEWLPVSSTGHMILVNQIWPMRVNPDFMSMFLVVIQLGAIMAVVITFWNDIWPFTSDKSKKYIRKDVWSMWFKVIVACIPAVIVGLKWDDAIEEHFYNYKVVSIMLILIGILFIIAENRNFSWHIALRIDDSRRPDAWSQPQDCSSVHVFSRGSGDVWSQPAQITQIWIKLHR